MNYAELKKLQESVFNRCLEVTEKKGNDYSKGNKDVLLIFKESASELGITMYQAIGLFMKKHTNAIFHYMKTGGQSESEPIRERVVDAINYLTFLLAAIDDSKENTVKVEAKAPEGDHKTLINSIEEMRKRKEEEAKKNIISGELNKIPYVKRYTKSDDVYTFPHNVQYTLTLK